MDRKIINKKIILFVVLILTLSLFAGCESGGDGKVTNSNVVACINNYPIPSYDIEGELYVSTDDLSHYGFNVSKSGKTSVFMGILTYNEKKITKRKDKDIPF